MAEEKPKTPAPRPRRRSRLRSTINLAAAILVALAVRAYVAEPFRIPTGSMEPTLLGAEGWGDRIFAGKFAYSTIGGIETSNPARWNVVVFYGRKTDALGRRTQKIRYIKRLIGKPGEKVEIRDGDIYIDDEISRKPPEIQEVLWHALYNPDFSRGLDQRHWPWTTETTSNGEWSFQDGQLVAKVTNHSAIRYTGKLTNLYVRNVYRTFNCPECQREIYATVDTAHTWIRCPFCGTDLNVLGMLRTGGNVRERYPVDPYEEVPMNDLRLDARFVPARTAVVTLSLGTRGRTFSLRYSASNERLSLRHPGGDVALGGVSPSPVGQVDVSLRFYDARLETYAFGELLKTVELEPLKIRRTSPLSESSAKVRVALGDVHFQHLAIYRDIYYTQHIQDPNGGVMLPGALGIFTVLGENEYWVMGDNSPSSSDSRYWGPVQREDFIGRAWFVFWPPHRIRWIR